MKKIIAAILFLGIVVGGVAFALTRSAERQLCLRMGELCAGDGDLRDYEHCVDEVRRVEKIVGEKPIERASECVGKANSCVEAMGCVAGTGYAVMPDLMNEFMKGFKNAQ